MSRLLAPLLSTGDEYAHPWRQSFVAGVLAGVIVGWQEHSVGFGILMVPVIALTFRGLLWMGKRKYDEAIPSAPWLPPPIPRVPNEPGPTEDEQTPR